MGPKRHHEEIGQGLMDVWGLLSDLQKYLQQL